MDWMKVDGGCRPYRDAAFTVPAWRCGLYLVMEEEGSKGNAHYTALKIGGWMADGFCTLEEAVEACEVHLITQRMLGSTYKPTNRNHMATAIFRQCEHRGKVHFTGDVAERVVVEEGDYNDAQNPMVG